MRRDLAGASHDAPAEVVGKDGKVRPSRRPTVVTAKNEREAHKAQAALAAVVDPPERRPFLPLALQALHSGSATGTHTPW